MIGMSLMIFKTMKITRNIIINLNKMIKKYFFIFVIAYFSSIKSSYAYLDPGTGGSIIQLIMVFLAAAGASISLYYKRLINFKKIFPKKLKNKI